jgi:biofilm PGA synthesis N-glycosyltransferase PgaC
MHLAYSIITAARDEAATLPRLADALRQQTILPTRWVIVENGSTDGTAEIANSISTKIDWVRLVTLPTVGRRERGAPIVRAFHAGLAALDGEPDIVVNVDADVTMEPDYFERLLAAFARNPRLGISSGSAWELDGGVWQQRFVTGGTVWGATRAYRWACLQDVLPLEERHGWDGIDQLRARARGWQCMTLVDLPFRHERPEGIHDGSRWQHWRANGETAYFMGYRPSYLLARTLHNAWRERAALGLVWGYTRSTMRREERLGDVSAKAILREDQRLRHILHRRREALGQIAPRRSETGPRPS